MFKSNLTESDIYQFIKEQKKNVPLHAMFWNVNVYPNSVKKNHFEFYSKLHNTNTIRPLNFYKPILSIINLDENKEL